MLLKICRSFCLNHLWVSVKKPFRWPFKQPMSEKGPTPLTCSLLICAGMDRPCYQNYGKKKNNTESFSIIWRCIMYLRKNMSGYNKIKDRYAVYCMFQWWKSGLLWGQLVVKTGFPALCLWIQRSWRKWNLKPKCLQIWNNTALTYSFEDLWVVKSWVQWALVTDAFMVVICAISLHSYKNIQ